MATQTEPRSRSLDPALGSMLARLRRRIRAYVWVDGLAAVLILLAGAFWVTLALDWTFEPPRPLRLAILAFAGAALVYVAYRFLAARLLVRLADRNMAVVLERRFGGFQDSLLTSVELTEHPDHAAQFNPEMLAHTRRDALSRCGEVQLGDVFNTAPLVRRVSLALVLVGSAVVFAVAAWGSLQIWAARTLLLSDQLWPRSTHLLVDGFDRQSRVKIARGSDWALVVRADAAAGREIPEVVEVRYSSADGGRGRDNMSREGIVTPGGAPFQNYAYTFKGVLSPLEFYVRGGDDRQGPYRLEVVDSPTVARMTLHHEYPAYMRRDARNLPASGLMQVPRGTQVTIRAEANKPLVSVQIDDVADENNPVTHQLKVAEEEGSPQPRFQFSLPPLDGDKTLLFTLYDADGIRSREAGRLHLAVIADEPPKVNVELKGIGTAITPAARLPASGEVSDDYAVASVWFEFHADETAPRQQPFGAAAEGREKLAVADALEVRDLGLQPKQKFHFAVRASDSFALDGGPNVGSGQPYVLDVVTPEQLRSMLEARELSLRRRFETVVEELTDTRNLLARVVADPAQAAKEKPAAERREPGDDAQAASESPANGPGQQIVQVERVLQNGERSAHETLQVALAFDNIREEMINNRVDTEELKTRLKDGVADPLKAIVDERFPKWEAELKRLEGQLADPLAASATQVLALAQVDGILVEMHQVLDKMLELETFNEVLDMLRQIIGAQEKISTETKQKQKQKLRDLTE